MSEKADKNYFHNFPNKMKNRFDLLEDDLEHTAPTLLKIGKAEPYIVPENYFENNIEKLKSLSSSKASKPKSRTMFWLSIAASFVAVGFGTWFWLSDNQLEQPVELAESVITDHYLENVDEIELELVLTLDDLEANLIDDESFSEEELDLVWDYMFEDLTELDLLNIL